MAQRRKTAQLKAGRAGGFENVEATSTFDLVGPEPVEGGTMLGTLLSFSGKHATPSSREIVQGFVMEALGTALLTSLVVLARWYVSGAGSGLGSFCVAIAYMAGLYAASHFNGSYVLRRHLSGPVTLSYLFTRDIGIMGVLFYKTAQTLGSVFAGLVLAALIGQAIVPTRIPVPFPTTVISSLTTAVCLEILVTGVLVLFSLSYEFLNTDSAQRERNYRHSRKVMGVFTAVVVLVLFQFETWTLNDNVYLTGLLSSMLGGTTVDLSNLYSGIYANSVFGTTGAAWTLYYLGAWAGGIAGGLVFWLVFWAFAESDEVRGRPAKWNAQPDVRRENNYSMASEMPQQQQQIESHLDQLINPLLKK